MKGWRGGTVLTEAHYRQEVGSVQQVPSVCYHGQHFLKVHQKQAHSHACGEHLLGFACQTVNTT